ncbi:predicted protein [Sclerotinia sclerotiorum 1980 UF-70]|uniref:Uncharacterized protein n=1 Tax=Sclerotinia sclerotiorum (strain ATCC 18683 / 1980 / Ss-1) TaxID=665079 RepID=A7EI00_SCLS1|nr:predicted protein [Sclerotinia sclerotiorum 1980 UF-70]EDO02466.1 predicted protein [Sclerotinia sclerotiorum 1980 UF-70]
MDGSRPCRERAVFGTYQPCGDVHNDDDYHKMGSLTGTSGVGVPSQHGSQLNFEWGNT